MEFLKKPLTRRIGFFAALLVAFLLGLNLRGGSPETDHAEHEAPAQAATVWTCSMHPQIQLAEPGACAICGMDLIPLESSGEEGADPDALTLSPAARKMAEIQTTEVVRRSVETTLRLVGKLEADETRVREITAWVPGRIDRLYIDHTGFPVRTGDKLFDLYSPELYSAQEELIQAVKASDQLSRSTMESTRRSASRTVEAVKERLRLWGLTDTQIEEVAARGTPSDHVTITAPMSGIVLHKAAVEGTYVKTGTHVYDIADLSVLWLKLDVYEADLARVELGQMVEFETDAYPGERFTGGVTFIDPVLDQRSRSIKVRVDVDNPDGKLKPGMFARATLQASVGGDDAIPPLVIPASAPLVTGTRAVAYVEDPDLPGQYQGREIVLGPRAGEFYVVREGLAEGERVVSHGSFKIDSAQQILARKSMMSPTEEGMPETTALESVPEDFLWQLDPVLAGYFEVGSALSHDSFDQSVATAAKLQAVLDGVDAGLLSSAGRAAWADARSDLLEASVGIAAAGDIDQARHHFYNLSVRMIETVRTFGASGRTPVLVFNCPMAMDGDGADWLQATEGTENPYYGSQMFKCGSLTETLAGRDEDDSHTDHTNH